MCGKLVYFAVACISVVAVVQSIYVGNGDDLLERNRREAKREKEMKNCCPGVPTLLKPQSKVGCSTPKSGTPAPGSKPRGNSSCWAECAFKNQNLVTAVNTLDKTAVAARVAELVAANPTWASVITAAYATCTATPPTIPATDLCKSGAEQIKKCMRKNLYMNCPTEVKNTSAECTQRLANMGIKKRGQ